MVVLCSTFHRVILFLGCTTWRGLPSDLSSTCSVCFASAACRPAYVLARTCSVRKVTFVVDRTRDELSDIPDELEMVSAFKSFLFFCFCFFCRGDYSMRVRLIDGFVFECFFLCHWVRWCGGRVPSRALFQSA